MKIINIHKEGICSLSMRSNLNVSVKLGDTLSNDSGMMKSSFIYLFNKNY